MIFGHWQAEYVDKIADRVKKGVWLGETEIDFECKWVSSQRVNFFTKIEICLHSCLDSNFSAVSKRRLEGWLLVLKK